MSDSLWPYRLSCQAPLSMGFSRQEHWSELPCPRQASAQPKDQTQVSLCLLHWQAGYLLLASLGSPISSISSVQLLSLVRLFATPWIAAHQASLSITNSWSSLRLTSVESVMPSSHLILGRPPFSCPQSLPASESFPMSQLFAWGGQSTGVSALASFSIIPSKHEGLISFRMDWLDLLAVQRTLKSLLQHHRWWG